MGGDEGHGCGKMRDEMLKKRGMRYVKALKMGCGEMVDVLVT